MGATLTTLNAITKEIYEGEMREQLNNATVLLKRVERTSKGVENTVGGRYVTFPIHTRRNSGIGSRNELEALPVAGQQGAAAARIGLKYHYGLVQLTGQAIKLIDTNYQAFQSSLELELNGLKTDLAIDQNRQLWGDGTGLIGAVTVAAGSAVNTFTVNRIELFQLDEMVDFVASGAVTQSNRKITSIDETASTITVSGTAFTAAVNNYFVRTGNLNREWTGLRSIVSATGTLYNVDPTVEPVWKSVVNTQGGTPTPIAENTITKLVDDIVIGKGGKITVLATTPGVRRAYANLLRLQRTYTNVKEFEGGFSGIGFTHDTGEIPIVSDYMAVPGTIYGLNEKALKVYRESDWEFMDMDGSKWARVPGYDAYGATMVQYSELGIDRRNTFGAITNIIEE